MCPSPSSNTAKKPGMTKPGDDEAGDDEAGDDETDTPTEADESST